MPKRLETVGSSENTPVSEVIGHTRGGFENVFGEAMSRAIGVFGATTRVAGYVGARTGAEMFSTAKKIHRGFHREPYAS